MSKSTIKTANTRRRGMRLPAEGNDTPLTESELKFCREYAIDHNGTRAYRLAFSTKSYGTAKTNASRLLTKANMRQEIAAIDAEHLRATGITARRVLRELAAIAFADPLDLVEPDGMTPRTLDKISPFARRAINTSKIRRRGQVGLDTEWIVEEIVYRMHDKIAALDRLAKHLGLTSDGEAIKQLLELVGQNRVEGNDNPTDGSVGQTAKCGARMVW